MAVTPVLKRFDTLVYAPNQAGPIVPLPGAVLRFYAQGATLSQPAEVSVTGESIFMFYYHLGEIELGSRLYVEGQPFGSSLLQVNDINTDFRLLTVANLLLELPPYPVLVGRRLVIVDKPLMVYPDPMGTIGGGPSVNTDSEGRAVGYVKPLRFDYTVTVGASNPLVFHDAEGSFVMRT